MLFGKKKPNQAVLGELWDIEPETVNYDSVMEWLVGLSDADYDKIVLTAPVYRNANNDAAKVLGKPNEPTTFIDPPQLLDDDSPAFLEDAPKPKGKKAK